MVFDEAKIIALFVTNREDATKLTQVVGEANAILARLTISKKYSLSVESKTHIDIDAPYGSHYHDAYIEYSGIKDSWQLLCDGMEGEPADVICHRNKLEDLMQTLLEMIATEAGSTYYS